MRAQICHRVTRACQRMYLLVQLWLRCVFTTPFHAHAHAYIHLRTRTRMQICHGVTSACQRIHTHARNTNTNTIVHIMQIYNGCLDMLVITKTHIYCTHSCTSERMCTLTKAHCICTLSTLYNNEILSSWCFCGMSLLILIITLFRPLCFRF